MVHHSNCPLCFSAEISQELLVTDHFKSKESFPLYRCAICGLIFTQDHPEESKMDFYYESEEYISHSDTSAGIVNKLYKVVRSRMLSIKSKMVRDETALPTGSLLDIGSGTGFFAASMKRSGWDVKGIEINEKARNYSREKFGLEILSPDEKRNLTSESFDCITLWHVLEHFNDLYGYLHEINRLLKPGGTCIVALPNVNSFDAEHYGSHWAAFDVPRHLWHFNPDVFGFLAEGRGFRMTNIVAMPFDVFYISILSEKYRNSTAPVIAGLVKGSWFALRSLFDKRRSSSLIYVLKR